MLTRIAQILFPEKFYPSPHDLWGKSNLPAKLLIVFCGLAGRFAGGLAGGLASGLAGGLEGGLEGGLAGGLEGGLAGDRLTVAVKCSSKLQHRALILVCCSVIRLQITTGSLFIFVITAIKLIKPECVGLSNHFTYRARRTKI